MDYYARALALREQTVSHRRFFHSHAEVGVNTPQAQAYVLEKLRELGIEAAECGHGVTAVIGRGEKCILLRADMDALPMAEESGEEFASRNGNCHACGHDFHAAMLLTAARLLKENEDNLRGRVKLMFQPGEEVFQGAADMIGAGVLENPKPDCALAFHIAGGKLPQGLFLYNGENAMMASADGFRIRVQGIGAHGAHPDKGVDPINIAVHIYLALEALMAREVDPEATAVMTVGSIHAGSAPNIIPDTAVMEGTIRTKDKDTRQKLVRRMQEVAQATAQVYGGTAEVTMLFQVPVLLCDRELTKQMAGYIRQLPVENLAAHPGISSTGSEDFSLVTEQIPGVMMYLSAGFPDERGQYPAHNPRVRFSEEALSLGAAAYAHCAAAWLEENG